MFDKIIRLSFIFSLVFIIFFVGYISHKYKAKKVFQTLEPLISSFEVYFDLDLDKKLGERKLRKGINNSSPEFDTNFSLMNKPSESFNKYLFIKQDNSGPVLMDNPNNIVWTWNLNKFRNPSKIIPYHLFENGDLILGRYESKGLFRINKDGKILWNKNYYNHHWISLDDENLYVPGTLFIDRQDLKDKIYEGSFVKNCKSEHKSRFGTIMIVDKKNGELKKEIFLIDAFYKDSKSREIIEKFSYNCNDTFHLNDVRVLTNQEAKFFYNGQKGDFLVSFRHLDMIALIDKKKHNIKWYVQGKFKYQHSPRITKNGTVLIFDNYYEGGRSRIIEIDIGSKEIVGYFSNKDFKFFSNTRGRIQLFDNKIFVQSSDQGEIFEIICEDTKYLSDEKCKSKFLYSSIFSSFYPNTGVSVEGKYVKDKIYIGDFYKNLNFFEIK